MAEADDKTGSPRLIQARVENLVPTKDNPRVINEKDPAFRELVESVRAQGVLVPVAVRSRSGGDGSLLRRSGSGYEGRKLDMRYGGRRLRAAQLAGLATIPALDYGDLGDEAAFELTFTENYQREDLSPIEQGRAVATLLARFKGDVAAVAAKLGRSERWVRSRMKLADLSPAWIKAVTNPKKCVYGWDVGHLELIAWLPAGAQAQALEEFGGWCRAEEMTVKQLDERLNKEFVRLLAKAHWKLDDETLGPKAGSCEACAKRSSREPDLFHEAEAPSAIAKTDKCLDPACWRRKEEARLERRHAELAAEHKDLVYITGDWALYTNVLELKKRYGEVIGKPGYTRVKKSAPGAKPALIVRGPGAGTLTWISTQRKGSSSRKTGPTPLSERRSKLKLRRWALVIGWVKTKLLDEKTPLVIDACPLYWRTVMALAAVFGAEATRHSSRTDAWQKVDKLAGDGEKVGPGLWAALRSPLAGLLNFWDASKNIAAWHQEAARRIAGLLGMDLKALRKEAAKEIPDPKSWKGLKADGTPREKAKKARKKVA